MRAWDPSDGNTTPKVKSADKASAYMVPLRSACTGQENGFPVEAPESEECEARRLIAWEES
ncbi:uncharacterized, partial [Tachysurus ichikawai]